MAAKTGPDHWQIWRGRDRRARPVGSLTGPEIDVLRLRGLLRPWGDDTPPILVCGSSVLQPQSVTASAKCLTNALISPQTPLIELMVTRCCDRGLRALVCDTARRYRDDSACAERAGAIGGMNWDGLALGGRIDGGRTWQAPGAAQLARQAQSRLAIIHAELGETTSYLLDRLILGEETRARLARRLGIQPSLLEGRAMAAMRALHEIYRNKLQALN
jgi:hypothetical protein